VKSFVRLPRYDNDEDSLLSIIPPESNAPAAKTSLFVKGGIVMRGNTYKKLVGHTIR
jgi:hypothetical protein